MPNSDALLVLIGPSACGKSTVARALAEQRLVTLLPTWTTRPRRRDEHGNTAEHRFVLPWNWLGRCATRLSAVSPAQTITSASTKLARRARPVPAAAATNPVTSTIAAATPNATAGSAYRFRQRTIRYRQNPRAQLRNTAAARHSDSSTPVSVMPRRLVLPRRRPDDARAEV